MSDDAKTTTSNRRQARHVTTACLPCREVKIKCDGKVPICGQCATKDRNCSYKGVDKRKVSVRRTVEAFSARLRQLESFIVSHNLAVPPAAADRQMVIDSLMDAYRPSDMPATPAIQTTLVPNAGENPPVDAVTPHAEVIPDMTFATCLPGDGAPGDSLSKSSQTADLEHHEMASLTDWPVLYSSEPLFGALEGDQFSPSNLDSDFPFNAALDADWVWNLSTMPQLRVGTEPDATPLEMPMLDPMSRFEWTSSSQDISTPTLLEDDDTDDDGEQSVVTKELSARLGALVFTNDIECHYYGATSNLSLVRSRTPHGKAEGVHQLTAAAQKTLDALDIGQKIDQDLTNRLIELYFTWHEPSLHVVDRETFDAARQRYCDEGAESTLYSLTLLNAMCAVGACFETRQHPAYPAPMAEFFADRAKALLDVELSHPRVATVQALAILSSHEAGYTRDSRGWLLSGMSIRLAFDLGLHLGTSPYVANGSMTAQEAKGRMVALWGSIATDRMWGLYLGRPSYSRIETITTMRQPSVPWDDNGSKPAKIEDTVTEKWIQLYEIMSPLEQPMYFQADVSKLELQSLAQKAFERLVLWKSTLPPELCLDTGSREPEPKRCTLHVLMLHLQYAFLTIILHRPFVAKHYIQPSPPVGRGHLHAREMSIRSAVEIATLLSIYEKHYSLRRANIQVVHITFTAALILVYATVSENNPHDHHELSLHLETCSHALAELGAGFQSAARTLDVLLGVKRAWQARLVAAVGSKRRRRSFAAEANPKRRTAMADV